MKIPLLAVAFLALSLTQASLFGDSTDENWHQWRGPDGTGVSPTADPPVEWSETKNVKWKVAIDGKGTSTPIIWKDKVFILTAIDTGVKDSSIPDPKDQPQTNFFNIKRPNTEHAFVVMCLDRESGSELWRRIATVKIPHEGAHNDNDFAPASPTTDGELLYCWFGSAGLFCYDLEGNKVWERDLGEVRVGSSLGEGCSPVLHGGKLVIVRDHDGQSTIEVLDAKSGKTFWKRDRDEDNAWATPIVVNHSGKTQVITAASISVRSYDLESGEVIWQCTGLTGNVTPCPVLEGDYVICMSGYKGYAAISIPLSETGDISSSENIRWKRDRDTPYIPSPLLYNGLLYYNQSNRSVLTCIDSRSGETVFGPERIGQLSNIYASPVGAAGRVYITGRAGKTLVIEKANRLKKLATNTLDDRFDASPALAGKQLFLRGAKYLYCLETESN
ncbi:MAG: PQQ-binding-like beta-propeller repeat protein [Pirellulaceae bacterium]